MENNNFKINHTNSTSIDTDNKGNIIYILTIIPMIICLLCFFYFLLFKKPENSETYKLMGNMDLKYYSVK